MIVQNPDFIRKNLSRGNKIYEGKANTTYQVKNLDTVDLGLLELESTDRISAGNGERKDVIDGKGIVNNTISTILFKLFEKAGIPTHFVCEGTNAASKIVRKTQMIELEVIGRFIAAGSFCKRYNIKPGKAFDEMLYELSYKSDILGDPFISSTAAAYGLELATIDELNLIQNLTYKIGEVAKEFFAQFGLTLVDFKVEFGRTKDGAIILCDEFSPDTCRLWDSSGKSYDKDVFRNQLGNVQETYKNILNKVTGK